MAKRRDITFNTMVTLPLLNALTAVVLAEQIITYARRESTLPLLIERVLVRLQAVTAVLKAEIQPREETDSDEKRRVDRVLDNARRAVNQWLSSLILMPAGEIPHRDTLQTLYDLFFSDGLAFINVNYREQWARSETRIMALDQGDFQTAIVANGGNPLFAHLRAAHAAYGDVLGISTAHDPEAGPAVREKYIALLDTIRAYVVKAVAWADPDEPGSEALSARLIDPVVNWQVPRIRSSDDDTSTDGAEVGDEAGVEPTV